MFICFPCHNYFGGRCERPVVSHIQIAELPAVLAVFPCFQYQPILGWGLRLGVPSGQR